MAIIKKVGMTTKSNSLSKKEFINFISKEYEVDFKCRANDVLVEETLTILPSRLDIAMLHREMSAEDRVKSIQSLQPIRTYKMIIIGSDIDDLTIGDEPQLDWDNGVALERLSLRDNDLNVITVSAKFAELSYADRTEMITANKPIKIVEYILARNSGVRGSYPAK